MGVEIAMNHISSGMRMQVANMVVIAGWETWKWADVGGKG